MTTRKVKSVCPYCGVGCGIVMEVQDNRVIKVTGDKEHPANFGRLCTKGSTSAQAIAESGRMEFAYIRKTRENEPVKTGMREAIRETAGRLRAILEAHGPDALSFYVSGQMSLEAQYLVNKLAKGFVGTNNIESNSRLCMASAGSGYKLSLGADGPPGSYQDMDRTDVFFVIGANMADCHPILFLRLMDRVKAGAKLIVVDPRRSATADKANLFMQIKPGTDLALLNGLLHLLVKNGHTDPAFIEEFTSGWDVMPAFLEDYPPDRVAAITGIPEPDIRQAAQWIGEAPEWMTCWTMGLNQSTHGTWHTNAICNLHLATGKICRPGSGPFSLTGQPNAMGGREMGYMGPGLPGQRSVLVDADRRFTEDLWQIPHGTLRKETGDGTISMFRRMQEKTIKACWIICTNPAATVANRSQVIAGLQAAELVIAQDAFYETETNSYADIRLPGALWSEGEGVMINSERNLTLMQKAVDPPGEAMPDWEIIARVACEMGYAEAFSYASAAEVYAEIQRAWNPKTGYDIRGATYERLRKKPLQWPFAPDRENDRSPIRYLNDGVSQSLKATDDGHRPRILFPTESGRGIFLARPYMAPAEMPDREFPIVLNTGRVQHQWHTLTKTGKIGTLNKLNAGPFVELHPEDAAALGIRENDSVEIRSRRGLAVLPAVVTDRVRPGNCFAPFHWNDRYGNNLAINAVTNDAIDPISMQPEFKFCAVSLVRAAVPAEDRPGHDRGLPNAEYTGTFSTAMKEEHAMVQLETLTKMLGIDTLESHSLEKHEKVYLSGFITSLHESSARSLHGIPVLPPTAPFEPIKRYWLDGVLAGLFSRTYLTDDAAAIDAPSPEISASAEVSSRPRHADKPPGVTILWASQTGNAEAAAEACAMKLREAGLEARIMNMNAYPVADLPQEKLLVLAASTFGAGDPPDNGAAFWHALQGNAMPQLTDTRYAVLAFGDSSYDSFCGFGRQLDGRLRELGGRSLIERTDCDTDYEETFAQWLEQLEHRLTALQAAPDIAGQAESMAEAAASLEMAPPAEMSTPTIIDRHHPLQARVAVNQLLNQAGSEKETRQYVFDLQESGLRYESGDALGVWPTNCPDLVEEMLTALGLDPIGPVHVKGRGEVPLAEALLYHYEISRITPEILRFVQERSGSKEIAWVMQNKDKEEAKQWLWGRQPADVLREFPIIASAAEWTSVLKPLQPRLYSISSSPKASPNEVHITVSTVRYRCNDNPRVGVCSAFLADRAQLQGTVPVFVHKNAHFRLPDDPGTAVIMIGSGTGIGPFRGFLHERKALRAKGKNWLFFGEQRAASDFYYREELETLQQEGYLHRLETAFSRDQAEKIYVQHRMLQCGAAVWQWLTEGAHVYVCGDAACMAKDVDAALKQIVAEHGGMSETAAAAYVQELSLVKRYARDVY
ncbi:bifunctional nitrate reductase/sulfite reductase flavoprotein subunit alpha [Paenibacillus sacheonensis]|uniref:assimilatory sulfite reductase (NADPH) n=1 Tax=Paenibacillus sacheonensis TaxID=742054 RepID=A0A7X4YN47_9BACL|nr:bifunctional nitrate reductase/sulfite reductase flavoprotein subunit alpha [Paenibacillus sacheonensis]NBC69387.1 molybdopterin-dependent oxidoreductase [Paenibacillus sacheonensis]